MKKYDLAVAQFIGFIHADRGHRLIDLVSSMGLTKSEWAKIKKESLGFKKSEIEEIDNLFK